MSTYNPQLVIPSTSPRKSLSERKKDELGRFTNPPVIKQYTLIEMLQMLRIFKGYSYGDLSHRCGYSRSYLCEILNGVKTPDDKLKKKLIDILQISP